jgi:hypothetical protein
MRGNMCRLTFDADEDVVDGGDEDEDEVEKLPCVCGSTWDWQLRIDTIVLRTTFHMYPRYPKISSH